MLSPPYRVWTFHLLDFCPHQHIPETSNLTLNRNIRLKSQDSCLFNQGKRMQAGSLMILLPWFIHPVDTEPDS